MINQRSSGQVISAKKIHISRMTLRNLSLAIKKSIELIILNFTVLVKHESIGVPNQERLGENNNFTFNIIYLIQMLIEFPLSRE